MVHFGPLAAGINPVVWGTPPNFNEFRVFAALLHGILVVSVSQSLRRWTVGATYIQQGDHHVGHWPTFLVVTILCYSVIIIIMLRWPFYFTPTTDLINTIIVTWKIWRKIGLGHETSMAETETLASRDQDVDNYCRESMNRTKDESG